MQLLWQTSALRLPRKASTARDRIVHAKSPVPSEGSVSPEALVDQEHRETCLETSTAAEIAVESRQQGQNKTASVEGVGKAAPRVHVRVGLEGLQDADRGQQPTVWAVARGDNASGEQACVPNHRLLPRQHIEVQHPHVLVAVFLSSCRHQPSKGRRLLEITKMSSTNSRSSWSKCFVLFPRRDSRVITYPAPRILVEFECF